MSLWPFRNDRDLCMSGDQWRFSSGLSQSVSSVSLNPSFGTEILRSSQNPHSATLTCGVRGYDCEKGQMETDRIAST